MKYFCNIFFFGFKKRFFCLSGKSFLTLERLESKEHSRDIQVREKGWKTILTRFLQIRKIKGVQWRVENGGECVNSANVVWKLLLGHFTGWLRPGKPDIDTFSPPSSNSCIFYGFYLLRFLKWINIQNPQFDLKILWNISKHWKNSFN